MTIDEAFDEDTWTINTGLSGNFKFIEHKVYPFIKLTASKTKGHIESYTRRREPTVWTLKSDGYSIPGAELNTRIFGPFTKKKLKNVFIESIKSDNGIKATTFNYLFNTARKKRK